MEESKAIPDFRPHWGVKARAGVGASNPHFVEQSTVFSKNGAETLDIHIQNNEAGPQSHIQILHKKLTWLHHGSKCKS